MRFFNIDFHVSVIADIADMFNKLGHTVDSHYLSDHSWVFQREKAEIPSLDGMSRHNFGAAECEKFYRERREELEQYDGFVVTHTTCMSGLYEQTGKPVICVVSTRYDNFCFTEESKLWLDETLTRMHASGQLILIANNRYDAWDVERRLGISPQVISSYCGYTNVKWESNTGGAILHGKTRIPWIPRLPERHSWEDLKRVSSCVFMPYNASVMSMFERHTMGVPLIVPSKNFVLENPAMGLFSELAFNRRHSYEELVKALELSDWYCGELEGVTTFDNERHLIDLLKSHSHPSTGQESRHTRILGQWTRVLTQSQTPRSLQPL